MIYHHSPQRSEELSCRVLLLRSHTFHRKVLPILRITHVFQSASFSQVLCVLLCIVSELVIEAKSGGGVDGTEFIVSLKDLLTESPSI